MIIVNPFYTIFNENNWFYSKETKKYYYSDQLSSIQEIFINIPFKDDSEYNKKINIFFSKFCKLLLSKVDNPKHKQLNYNLLDYNKEIIIYLEPVSISEFKIEVNFKIINHQ
jgi:hypothetical protein